MSDLPAVVAKELADNALDASGGCRVEILPGNGFRVADDGDGIDGDDAGVARLFSVNRPLVSSKLLRLPTRGAFGNGLRVVAGAVLASRGTLTVATRGRVLALTPQYETGETLAERVGDYNAPGTRIDVRLGPALEVKESTLTWARRAIAMGCANAYGGKTSPHWYDTDSFLVLLRASEERTVRGLIAEFDGCSGTTAAQISANYKGRLARSLSRDEAESLLLTARAVAKPVTVKRLGHAEAAKGFPAAYCRVPYTVSHYSGEGSAISANVPYLVEAWAAPQSKTKVTVYVNRTPITGQVDAQHEKRGIALFGCKLEHVVTEKCPNLWLTLNITAPYIPKMSGGKSPDLSGLLGPIREAATRAAKRAKRVRAAAEGPKPENFKAVILANITPAADKAGGGGEYRFSLRQLYYAVRTPFIAATSQELKYKYFCDIITGYENEHGDIPGMYRDPRGILYHPHVGQEIALGTLSVEKYKRPEWRFNKCLYSEKEGLFSILRAVGWPERNDCALLTSKGYASRAARDVIDLLGETGEELRFFAVHDADAYGTTIYESLQEATRARKARTVEIINLGLEPDEALAMGLESEAVEAKDERRGVAAYVTDPKWREWLQTHRVELNAMSSPQFLEWLDDKFRPYAGKVVPPDAVLAAQLEANVRQATERRITDRVLREANIGERTDREVSRRAGLIRSTAAGLAGSVRDGLAEHPENLWTQPVSELAESIARANPERVGA